MAADIKSTSFFGKYRAFALSVLVLIFVIVFLLILNIVFSHWLARSAEITNAASRQSGLVQKISKDLLFISSQYQKVLPYDEDKKELKKTMDEFEGNLLAFSDGGTIMTSDADTGENIELIVSKIPGQVESEVLQKTKTIWEGYRENVYPIFEEEENDQSTLLNATIYAEENNQVLSELSGELSNKVKEQDDQSLQYFRWSQIIGILLAIALFLWTIFRTVRDLRRNDEELEKAQQETTGILNTVREGLFLLDEDLVISSQYSNEMQEIFETPNVGGRAFTDLIDDIVSPAELKTVQEFVKLLFDPEKIETLIESLNPLEQIKVSVTDKRGDFKVKYLNFKFYRVMQRDKIRDILVSVRDISDQVLLQQQLEITKEQGEQQIEMLVSFLHADPKLLKRFLIDTRKSLEGINDILKEPVTGKADFKFKIDKMFIEVHRMKGEAGAMKFEAFADKAHEFENELTALKKVSNIEGLDFLPLVIQLDNLISYTDTLGELSSRIGSSGTGSAANLVDENKNKSSLSNHAKEWSHLPELVDKISADTGKKVDFVMSGFIESNLDEDYRGFVNDISIQLIRNSLIHGIESDLDRKKKSKNEKGRIDLRVAKLTDGSVELIVRDDGKGIDLNKIRNKVVELGQATKEEVAKWSDDKVVNMAFQTGFSTADKTTMHAGRGVGLDVIRDRVKQLNGKLILRQMAEKFCQFEIVLPPQAG